MLTWRGMVRFKSENLNTLWNVQMNVYYTAYSVITLNITTSFVSYKPALPGYTWSLHNCYQCCRILELPQYVFISIHNISSLHTPMPLIFALPVPRHHISHWLCHAHWFALFNLQRIPSPRLDLHRTSSNTIEIFYKHEHTVAVRYRFIITLVICCVCIYS